MLGLALPVLAEESLTMLVGYTDWWLVARFLPGAEYKAAMGLMAYLLWLIPSLFAAVAIGATALVSRSVGAGESEQASRYANQAVLIGWMMTAVAMAVVWAGGRHLVGVMQLQGPAAELALRYLWIVTPAIPAIMVEQVGVACLRGAGDTVSGFVAKSLVNVVNVIVSTLLVLGPGFVPRLGWEGIAIGTAGGHLLGGLIVLGLLLRGRAGVRLQSRWLRPNGEMIRRLWRIGMPSGIDVLAVLGCHFTYLAIINSLGVEAAAAHGLGVQIEALAYLPCQAFYVAAATMTGQFLGAGDRRRAAYSARMTCSVAVLMLTGTALIFFFGGDALAAFFTGDPQDPTALEAGKLLRIVAFSTPPLAVLMVLTGALRGAGDTRWPLMITFLGLIGIRLPLACFLAWQTFDVPWLDLTVAGRGLGVAGAWWAMVTDVSLRSGLILFRFRSGGWATARV